MNKSGIGIFTDSTRFIYESQCLAGDEWSGITTNVSTRGN
jgi:hypothetical protein